MIAKLTTTLLHIFVQVHNIYNYTCFYKGKLDTLVRIAYLILVISLVSSLSHQLHVSFTLLTFSISLVLAPFTYDILPLSISQFKK